MLKLGGAAAVALSLGVYFLQDKLIFFPRPLTEFEHRAIAAAHADVADVFLQADDGTRIHAWHVKSRANAPLVLYFGGNAENVSWMLDELPRHATDAAWLLIDYRGYGSSAGAPSERALNADAVAWYDYGAKTASHMFALGRSLGSGVAVRLAAERKLDGVLLVAPFDSLAAVGKRHYPYLPVQLLLKHRFDSLALASQLDVPLLCIVATHDEVIPAEHAKRLFEAWHGPKRLVEMAAGHDDIDRNPDYWPRVRAFVAGR